MKADNLIQTKSYALLVWERAPETVNRPQWLEVVGAGLPAIAGAAQLHAFEPRAVAHGGVGANLLAMGRWCAKVRFAGKPAPTGDALHPARVARME